MTDGPDDLDADDGGNPEEGPILSPEELDIADDEHVTQLDESRYVVSSDVRPEQENRYHGTTESDDLQQGASDEPDPAETTASSDERMPKPETSGESAREQTGGDVTREEVHRWLRESFAGGGSRYGFDVTATFDESISQRRMASNDVVTIFESLVLWYAQQIDRDTPVEEILGILLMEANVPVRYPPESLKNLVKSTGLGPDDTIADLLAAVDEDDGVEL